MSTIVSYKLAKLLKEKNFKELCNSAYVNLEPLEKFDGKITEYLHAQNHNEKKHRFQHQPY